MKSQILILGNKLFNFIIIIFRIIIINPLASPSEGVPALKYEDVNIVTPSPVEVKGLINIWINLFLNILNQYFLFNFYFI